MVRKGQVTARRRHRARLSRGDLWFDTLNALFMVVFLFIMAYPLYFTIIASFSDVTEVGLGHVVLWPKGFTTDAYRQVFINSQIWTGYRNSLLYTVMGVCYNLCLMIPLAYALSKKWLLGRGFVTWFFLFTMYFGGGMVPSYLLLANTLRLSNTIWVMVLGGVSVYNMIVTRTYFQSSIPEELYESAEIDGANQFVCFLRIAIPLSAPIIAVMALYDTVGIWNSYFNAMIYMTRREMWPLQLVLRSILIENNKLITDPELLSTLSPEQMADELTRQRLADAMKYSLIFIASAPLLMAYPFAQKFFVKGVMIGSLKG